MTRLISCMLLFLTSACFAVDTQTCIACHGTDGNLESPTWPKIAGMSREYLIKQLHDFQAGEEGPRFEPTMLGMVQNLNDQDIADLADFYASKEMTIGTTELSSFELGQRIYKGGNPRTGVAACAACHSHDGKGNDLAKFPRLSGQNPGYIIEQLNKFKSQERSNDPNGMMRDIAAKLSDEEIKAVASYVTGLH